VDEDALLVGVVCDPLALPDAPHHGFHEVRPTHFEGSLSFRL
jgi:hypothetical protein